MENEYEMIFAYGTEPSFLDGRVPLLIAVPEMIANNDAPVAAMENSDTIFFYARLMPV